MPRWACGSLSIKEGSQTKVVSSPEAQKKKIAVYTGAGDLSNAMVIES